MDAEDERIAALARIAELQDAVTLLQARNLELERELATLLDGLDSRTLIGRATGLLAAGLKRPVDDAWEVLRRTSSYSNVKLREVARLLVLAHDGSPALAEDAEDQEVVRVTAALERAVGSSTQLQIDVPS